MAPALLLAAEKRKPTIKRQSYNPEHQSVDLFAAMKAGQIEAKIILKDSTTGRVFLSNKTKEPLNVRLPGAFVAVLKQFDDDGGFGDDQGGGGDGQGRSSPPMDGAGCDVAVRHHR